MCIYICGMTSAAKTKLLLVSNIVLAAAIVFLLLKSKEDSMSENAQEAKEEKPHHYTDNGQYVEQVDFYSVFNTKAKIVFLGNSHFYRMNWDELLGRKDVANRGIGSDITEGYKARMSSVLSLQPKICFIEGGGNDIDFKVSEDSIIHNLREIVDTLKAHQIKPVLTAVFFAGRNYPHNDSNKYNMQVASLNKAMHQLAEKDSIEIIDINNQLNEDEYLKPEFVRNDGIHLTSKAYLIWKDAVQKVLMREQL